MSISTSLPWVVLFYLNDDGATLRRLAEIGSSPQIQWVVQQNIDGTAARYRLPAEATSAPEPQETVPCADPGNPVMLVDFLQWAQETIEASRVALVCQAGALKGLVPIPKTRLPICEIEQMRQVFSQSLQNSGRSHIDILLFLSPPSQFIEVADQLADVVTCLVGAQTNDASPADIGVVANRWQQVAAASSKPLSPSQLAAHAVDASPAWSAIKLSKLNSVTRAFDALTMALLQSLGDDIIWRVVWNDERQEIFPALPAVAKYRQATLDLVGWLKFVQLQLATAARNAIPQWYVKKIKKTTGAVHADLRRIGRHTTDPDSLETALTENLHVFPEWLATDFHIIQSQRQRAVSLADMAGHILTLLHPSNGLIYAHTNPNAHRHGLSLFLPPDIDRLTETGYLNLGFCRRTHWTSLLGAINLIAKHPRALWRLSSSLLTTAGSTVREDLLRRLIGSESVMVGFREQFQALANPAKLTLTLEPQSDAQTDDPINATNTYRLRLESPETGATVLEQHSHVNPQTIDTALDGLQDLLARGWVNSHRMGYLESLGRTLGEDIIQNLADNLQKEYRHLAWLSSGNTTPHLQLQLPRQLMRYPWELLHDGVGLLLERYALGRQVFSDTAMTKPKPLRPSGGIRALIIGDPLLDEEFRTEAAADGKLWQQLPGAAEEARQVAAVFCRLSDIFGSSISFHPNRDTHIHSAITCLQFRELLRNGDYDIIHFAGHALFDADNPEQSAWLFSDGPLWAQEIHNTLARAKRSPWLVYANACEAAMEGNAPVSRYQGDVFGLATAFIQQGIAAYIAPLWRINDTLAAQMAIDFYHALLLDSTSLGEALRFARLEAKQQATGVKKNLADAPPLPAEIGLGWASMVLYGDPTARLFDTLWTPHHLSATAVSTALPQRATLPRRPQLHRPQHILQASIEETLALVSVQCVSN